MPEVKIGVGANAGNVEQAIARITSQMNKLGAAVAANQKLKFEPTDVKTMERDLSLVNKQFQQAIQLSAQLRNALKTSGQSGLHLSQIDFSKLSTSPQVAQRMRDRAFLHAVQGTALDPTLANEVDEHGRVVPPGVPSGAANRRSPGGAPEDDGSSVGRRKPGIFRRAIGSFGRGVGGTTGGTIGAAAEAEGGIGAMGAAAGGFIVANLALKAGEAAAKFVGEGVDLAKQNNEAADILKRQMGDLGISFANLKKQSMSVADSLGVSVNEFLGLERQAFTQSGGVYETPDELKAGTTSGVDLARAYGMGTARGVSFVAGMDQIDPHRNNKELATEIAEAIGNSQGHATPDQVMNAMQEFASMQNRFNAQSVNLDRVGNAFSSLVNDDGMTADHASSILGTANSAMEHMGGSEAAQNFTMRAFGGGLDPIESRIRAEGGLYANGLENRDIRAYMGRSWHPDMGPSDTNFGLIRAQLDRDYGGNREMELDAAKNYFHLSSYADTAAFMRMSDSDHNGLMMTLKNAGVDLSQVREGGIQALSGISRATTFDDLRKLYEDGPSALRNRHDMSTDDRNLLDRAEKSGDFNTFQKDLVQVMAGKGQQATEATVQRSIDATLTNIKADIGNKLIPATNTMKDGVLSIAKFFGVSPAPDNQPSGLDKIGLAQSDPAASIIGPDHKLAGDKLGVGAMLKNVFGTDANVTPGVSTGLGDWIGSKTNELYGQSIGTAFSYRDTVSGAMTQLGGMGIDKDHAAAIVANAIRESSMNPAAQNGDHYGLFQLDPARQRDFAKIMGNDIHGASSAEQIAYMVKSMMPGGEEGAQGKAFWASTGANAAGVFAAKVERTDHVGKESEIRAGIASALAGDGDGKIPAKYRAAAHGNVAAITAAQTASHQGAQDIHVHLEQTLHEASATGQLKTKKLNTSISVPPTSGTAKATLAGN